jgi:hypothetical protein
MLNFQGLFGSLHVPYRSPLLRKRLCSEFAREQWARQVRARLETEALIQQDAELQAAAEAEAHRILQAEAEQELADQAELQAHADFLAQQADAEEAAQLMADDCSEANDALATDLMDWISEDDVEDDSAYPRAGWEGLQSAINTEEQIEAEGDMPMYEQLQAEQWCAQNDAELRATVALFDSQSTTDTGSMQIHRANAHQRAAHAGSDLYAAVRAQHYEDDDGVEWELIDTALTQHDVAIRDAAAASATAESDAATE